MELFSAAWWSALGAIIVIDLVLAGDNALVIGIAASRLPGELRRKAVIWGAVGAIGVRAILTVLVVWLLKIPGLLLVGGLLLLPIAYKLAVPPDVPEGHSVEAGKGFWDAMRTIIVADALMGVDNMLAVGGAAHGRFDLVVIGLLISIPLVVWGSTFIAKLMGRWPIIAAIGAAILAFTAASMFTKDPFFDRYVYDDARIDMYVCWAFAVALFLIGFFALRRIQAAGKTAGAIEEAAEAVARAEPTADKVRVDIDAEPDGGARVSGTPAPRRP
ncbi:MAG: TerC family protein [Lautropia sp.]